MAGSAISRTLAQGDGKEWLWARADPESVVQVRQSNVTLWPKRTFANCRPARRQAPAGCSMDRRGFPKPAIWSRTAAWFLRLQRAVSE